MNREEYLRRLSYLLQDLPEEEYREALEYYEDYFDEAGPQREQEVIRELGKPERIAAMIRDSVKEKDGDWEYTEEGYYNRRYDEKNQMPGKSGKEQKTEKEKQQRSWHMKGSRDRNIILLVIILALAAGVVIPAAVSVVLGIGGGILGLAGGVLGVALAACVTCVGLLIGGVAVIVTGIVKLFTAVPAGLLLLGCGCMMAAGGLLLLMLAVWMIGDLLPKLIRWIVGLFRKLFQRGGEKG